jgi:hypothetical protein
MSVGHPDAGFEIGRPFASTDGDHLLNTSIQRALNHRIAIGIEDGIIQMAMGINHLLGVLLMGQAPDLLGAPSPASSTMKAA